MLKILEKLTKSLSSSADIAAAIDEARQVSPDALAALGYAEAKRASLLLSGTDSDILAAEREITTARLTCDRLEAAIAELERRHNEAMQTETTARLTAECRQLEKQATEAAKAFEAEALAHLRQASRVFNKLIDTQNAITNFNISNSLTPNAPHAAQPIIDHRTVILLSEVAPMISRHFSIVAPDRSST